MRLLKILLILLSGILLGLINPLGAQVKIAAEPVSKITPAMHEYFLNVTEGAFSTSGELQKNNYERITDQSQSFIKAEEGKSLLRFTAGFSDDLVSIDYCVVYFDQNATNEYNGQLDALKLMNTDFNVPNVYVVTPSGTKISIKALPYGTDTTYIVQLGLSVNKAGEIVFKLKDIEGTFSGMRISLIDQETGKEQDLLNNREYKISLDVGEYHNRFFLNLSNNIVDISDLTKVADWININPYQGILKVNINLPYCEKSILTLHNLIGQTLFIYKINEPGYHEFRPIVKDGIYIVTFNSHNKRISKKIFLSGE